MAKPLSLFEAIGIELEYMIVAADSLDVCPITDRVLHSVAGAFEAEVELGDILVVQRLALHVIELKTTDPIGSLAGLSDRFQANVARINDLLLAHNARLMPTAMHPWMDPHAELKLWPHDYSAVYDAFNRVFDCTGHGWANLAERAYQLAVCQRRRIRQAACRHPLATAAVAGVGGQLADHRASG